MTPSPDLTTALCRIIRPLFVQHAPTPSRWRSVLVLKPCCIGDVLQSTALVAALRQAFPTVKLGYAVGPWSQPILGSNPHLDRLVDTGPVIGGKIGNPGQYLTLAQRLRHGKWDAVFVLEHSPLFSLAARLAGIPDIIGLDNASRGIALTVRVPVRPRRQEAESCLDLLRAIGVEPGEVSTEFYPTANDDVEVSRHLGDARNFVVLAPGGGVNPGTKLISKRWPAEGYGQVGKRLAVQGYKTVVIGGPQDHREAEKVEGISGALNLCGRLSLTGCGALLRRAALFVGNDTGLMHLAAAVGTPVVALFGPTDPAIYGPYKVPRRVIWHPQRCGPCFRQRNRRPQCRQECIKAITVDEVEDAALQLLQH